MILIRVNDNTVEKAEIVTTHYAPFDEVYGFGKTREELEADGAIFVDNILEPENNGKGYTHYINPKTKEQWYEYYELPLSDAERIAELEKTQGDLLLEIALLKMGGMF